MDNQLTASTYSTPKSTVPGKITWPDESSKPQNFSLPSSIIYYISKNPSTSTVYLKLAQSCKYFFEKLPLLIAKDIFGSNKLCPNDERGCDKKNQKCCVEIDLTKISSKIWLTNKIIATPRGPSNVITLLSSKLYQCDVYSIKLHKQQVFLNDLKFAASFVTEFKIEKSEILYSNGKAVLLDGILDAVPNVARFVCYCTSDMINSSTFKNILKLKNFTNLYQLELFDIPEISSTDDVLMIITVLKNARIRFQFRWTSSEDFKIHLNSLVDTVIKDETLQCLIEYYGQDDKKFKIMNKQFFYK